MLPRFRNALAPIKKGRKPTSQKTASRYTPKCTYPNKDSYTSGVTSYSNFIDLRAKSVEERKYDFSDEEKVYFKIVFEDTPEKVIEEHNAMSSVWRVSRLQEAYNKAHDIRKFEIELYWKRNNYFWLMETILLTGLFLSRQYEYTNLVFLVSLGGILFTDLWICATAGAKFWQENWEKHIDFLEKAISGKLHGSIWKVDENNTQFSVSSVNVTVVYGFAFFWFIAGYMLIGEVAQTGCVIQYQLFLIIFQITVVIVLFCTRFVQSSENSFLQKKIFPRKIHPGKNSV